ncbi:MAG: MOSC domain-containing protein, partial [Planctomycetia bacterium]
MDNRSAAAVVVSLQVGSPKTYGTPDAPDPMDREWTTAFFKEPADGPVSFGRLGGAGDVPADQVNHGGVDKAVLAYSADHYPAWKTEQPDLPWPFGAFGETLTVR